MNLYGALFRSVLLPAWEKSIRKRPTLTRRDFLERTQWRSRDEILAIQEGALRRLLRHAFAHVPLYRDRFLAAGLTDQDVRTPEDLLKLPLLTREDARASVKERTTIAPPFPTIKKNTGGTTGEPLLFAYDDDSEYWRNAMKLRGYGWGGYHLGDRVLHFWGAPVEREPPPAKRAKVALDRWMKRETYIYCGVMDDALLRRVAHTIARDRPRVLVCYTQAGAELARFINKNGLRDWPNMFVICGAERLYPHDRADLEVAFGPAIHETYGCREVMLIAAECEAHEGLHLSMENVLVELVVTEPGGTQRHARAGEIGAVVLTDLHNYGMPFIRYANGDVAIAGPATRCPCGRALDRLASVEGRAADTLRDAAGAAVSGLVFNVVFTGLAAAVRQFQVVQHKDRSVTLRVVPGESFDHAALDETRRECARFLRGVPVSIEVVGEIPRTRAGKLRVVVVEG